MALAREDEEGRGNAGENQKGSVQGTQRGQSTIPLLLRAPARSTASPCSGSARFSTPVRLGAACPASPE